MTDEVKTFGQYISEARKALGMSQKDLANSIMREDEDKPISPQYLNDIERDRRSVSSDHLIQQFANVLNLDAGYLHYLNNRWPAEMRNKLTEPQFKKQMAFFRRGRRAAR